MNDGTLTQLRPAEEAQRSSVQPGRAARTRPIFVAPNGHRRRWVQAGAVLSILASSAFVGALTVVLQAAPGAPQTHAPGVNGAPNVAVAAPHTASPGGVRR